MGGGSAITRHPPVWVRVQPKLTPAYVQFRMGAGARPVLHSVRARRNSSSSIVCAIDRRSSWLAWRCAGQRPRRVRDYCPDGFFQEVDTCCQTANLGVQVLNLSLVGGPSFGHGVAFLEYVRQSLNGSLLPFT